MVDIDKTLGAVGDTEDQFRILVQGVTDYAIYLLSPAGIVTSWNVGAERIKGYSHTEIVGQHFSCFYTDEDRAAGRLRLFSRRLRGRGASSVKHGACAKMAAASGPMWWWMRY